MGNKKDDEILYSVKCEYENYRKARCSYLKSYELNGELVSELRRLKYKDYYKDELKNANTVADTIERIDKIWKDELTFTDEKMQKIFENIINLSHNAQTKKDAETVVNELKTGITSFNSFCDGRIYEMNSKLVEMKYKLQKRKINAFFTWIGWIVGIVSGLITIFS